MKHKILFVVAHPDDESLWIGGTLSFLAKRKEVDVYVLCATGKHDEERSKEFENALKTDADIIGINNRNLDTLEINLETTKQLLENFQKSKIILSESGIKSTKDIKFLRDCGADAFLIGTSIMKSSDIQNSVSELVNAI